MTICLPHDGEGEEVLAKASGAEPPRVTSRPVRGVDRPGTALTETGAGKIIETVWSRDVSWSKELQFQSRRSLARRVAAESRSRKGREIPRTCPPPPSTNAMRTRNLALCPA